jgi:hypothetical protein
MNFKTLVAPVAALTLALSGVIAAPAQAQNYGNGYGYNNNTQNSYGNNPYTQRRQSQVDLNQWQPSSDFSRSRNSRPSGCSSLSMSSACY